MACRELKGIRSTVANRQLKVFSIGDGLHGAAERGMPATKYIQSRSTIYTRVGFASMTAQAKIYKDAGNTLVWTQSQSSDQLGPGVYISPNLGDWPATPSDWYCVILADSTPWNPTNKAWVPERHNGKALWWNAGAANRAAYLREIGGSNFRPDNTVRLSIISGFRLLQLLIPPELIKDPNHLKTRTQCAAKTDEAGVRAIAAYGPVDWSRWPNVKGTPQRP